MRYVSAYAITFTFVSVTVLSAVTVLPLCPVCDDDLPCQPGTVCVDNLCVETDLPYGEECNPCKKCGPFLDCQFGECWSPNTPPSDCGGQCGSLNYSCKEGLTCVDELCECEGTLVCDDGKCVPEPMILASPPTAGRRRSFLNENVNLATVAPATKAPDTKASATRVSPAGMPATDPKEKDDSASEVILVQPPPRSLCGGACGFAGHTCVDGLRCAAFKCACGDEEICDSGVCLATELDTPPRPPSPLTSEASATEAVVIESPSTKAPSSCGGHCGWFGYTCAEGLECDFFRCVCNSGRICVDGTCSAPADSLFTLLQQARNPPVTKAPVTQATPDFIPSLGSMKCGGYCGWIGLSCDTGLLCKNYRCACPGGETCENGVCA